MPPPIKVKTVDQCGRKKKPKKNCAFVCGNTVGKSRHSTAGLQRKHTCSLIRETRSCVCRVQTDKHTSLILRDKTAWYWDAMPTLHKWIWTHIYRQGCMFCFSTTDIIPPTHTPIPTDTHTQTVRLRNSEHPLNLLNTAFVLQVRNPPTHPMEN